MYLACFSTGMKELLSMQVLFWPSKTWSMKNRSSRMYEKRVMCKLTFVFIYVNWPLYCRGVISYFALSQKSIINGGNFWWETKQNNNKTTKKAKNCLQRRKYLSGRKIMSFPPPLCFQLCQPQMTTAMKKNAWLWFNN